jgi:pilus assembly protein CpaE
MAYILVIDDDTDFRGVLKLMLTRLGHSPTLASRGEEGLALAVSNKYDLVLLDLMLPDLDGFEVARRLRNANRTRNLPILILTARSQAADREGALEAGADGYLTKPVDPRELATKITEMLSISRAEPPPSTRVEPVTPTAPTLPGRAALGHAPASGFTPPPGPPPAGRVLVVLGLRGGVGKTTVAVTLAGALARAGKRVCLLDLCPTTGHVVLQLRVRPKATWADLPPLIDTGVMAQAITRHDSGVFVMAAPGQPVRASLTADAAQAVLYYLRSFFTDVVVDAAPVLDDATHVALTVCKQTILVLTPDVGSVETARGTLRTLAAMNIADAQVRLALNYTSPDANIPQAAVEKALGRLLDVVIPFEKAQAAALAQGMPLILSQPQTPLAQAMVGLAAKL